MKEDGCKSVAHPQRQGGRTAPAWRERRDSPRRTAASRSQANDGIDKNAPNYRSLASKITGRLLRRSRASPARTASRCSRTSRRPARRQALRPGRRGRGGLHRPEGGRHPGGRRRPHEGHGRDARPWIRSVPARRPGVLRRLQGRSTASAARPVRDLRLRGDERSALDAHQGAPATRATTARR